MVDGALEVSDAVSAGEELVASVRRNGGETRLLGGIAVALRCPSVREGTPFARRYSDIDLVTQDRHGRIVIRSLEELGYVPEERFNALHGHQRLLFGHQRGYHVDVFVEQFVMCHRLELGNRLEFHDTTLGLADLLLTKLQIAELNLKDVTDIAALLIDHELTDDEAGINRRYIATLLSRDWGWWRSVSGNLGALSGHLQEVLPEPAVERVRAQIAGLMEAIDGAPKSLRWKTRAKVGERVPWRDEPEEAH